MTLEVESFSLTNALLCVDYFKDGVMFYESFPIESFEAFCVANGLLEWHDFRKVYDGDTDEREGVWDFSTWCNDKLTDKEILLFLKSQLKIK